MPGIQIRGLHEPERREPLAFVATTRPHAGSMRVASSSRDFSVRVAAPDRRPLARDTAPVSVLEAPSRSYAFFKRSFDLLAALLLALVVLLLIPVIAIAIKLDSPGAVFYQQLRVGQGGRVFRIYKFRSMRADAERHGAVWAMEADPRVTRVGDFMRRSRIDELPQLLNVLRGEMTFVGPRPERPEFTSVLERELPGYGARHLVKPGLTGWAQIRYQYASSVRDTATKLDYDLQYVRRRSLLFDAKILVQTIPVVFHLQGR